MSSIDSSSIAVMVSACPISGRGIRCYLSTVAGRWGVRGAVVGSIRTTLGRHSINGQEPQSLSRQTGYSSTITHRKLVRTDPMSAGEHRSD